MSLECCIFKSFCGDICLPLFLFRNLKSNQMNVLKFLVIFIKNEDIFPWKFTPQMKSSVYTLSQILRKTCVCVQIKDVDFSYFVRGAICGVKVKDENELSSRKG